MSHAEHTHGQYRTWHRSGSGLIGTSSILGASVCNHKDEALGIIKEIMLDMHSGKVAYAVLSFDGFLGIGEKLFAVPWHALTFDRVHSRVILSVRKDLLAEMPGFDQDCWPEMADASWAEENHS